MSRNKTSESKSTKQKMQTGVNVNEAPPSVPTRSRAGRGPQLPALSSASTQGPPRGSLYFTVLLFPT